MFKLFPLTLVALAGMVSPLENLHAASATAVPTQDNVRYVGATTCQSSMCHGGASPARYQFPVWSQQDFHSRAYATLTTARSARMAEALGLGSATQSPSCTVCHAPYQMIPSSQLAPTVDVAEGVSCESCHGGAGSWLRTHTRPDLSYADRVHAGMRDLRSAYVRANTCVACHQVIDAEIIKAGHPELADVLKGEHPELVFELDGQSASEPRHWQEKDDWFGPKAWLVGQAVALREISRRLAVKSDPDLVSQQQALVWLLQQVPTLKSGNVAQDPAGWSDQLAQTVSGEDWKKEISVADLRALAATSNSFLDPQVSNPDQAMRAERLVLGLDRLFKSLHPEPTVSALPRPEPPQTEVPQPGQAELSALFADVQSGDPFDPKTFSDELRKFADAIKSTP